MTAQEMKCRKNYMTAPFPSCGVKSEVVRTLGRESINGETWFRVRFDDGGVVMMHPSNILCEA